MKTVELTIGKLTYFTKNRTNKKLHEKKLQYKLDALVPHSLSERVVDLERM